MCAAFGTCGVLAWSSGVDTWCDGKVESAAFESERVRCATMNSQSYSDLDFVGEQGYEYRRGPLAGNIFFATRYFHVDALRLAHRPPRPQALPSPTGLCAGAPAGRSADSVRTTQLLGTSAGRLRCDAAQAGPSQACTRSSGCSLAAGMLVVLRAGVPALPQAVGEDGERAAGQ